MSADLGDRFGRGFGLTNLRLRTRDLIVRTSNIREFLDVLKEARIKGISSATVFDIIQMADRYEKVIDNPLMVRVSEKLNEFSKAIERMDFSASKSKFTLRRIGELTGFFEVTA